MTLSATPAVDRYTADGSQTVFDYNFKILDASHLQVFFGDSVQDSGFTVSGVNNDTGGTVTFDTAPTSGVIVTLRQEVPLDQPSALPNQGPFPSQTVETQIADRIVMQNKQQQEELDRSVKVAVSSTLTNLDLTPDAGKFVAWNQDGDALIGADATPDTVPVSAFGATLVDDADASAALTTLGHSDYVKNNLIASASADAHLATLLPAIDTVLETITGLVGVGVFHPAMDEHPEWYDGVSGARSRFMMATAQTAGGNSTVKVWDLTVAMPVVLQTITLNNSVVSAISDINGGVLAIATEDGLYRRGWTKAGFGAINDGLPDPITSATVPALTNNDLDDVCIGYSDQPAGNPATGGQKPTIGGVYGTGADAAFILKDDGKLFDALGTVGDVGCGIAAGWFYHADAPASHRMVVDRISEIQGDDWGAFTFLSNGQDPFGFGVGNDFDITPGQEFAAASADGLTVGKITGVNRAVDERFTALINRIYNTGWIVGDIRGAWLANGSGVDDRSYQANTLTENGTVADEPSATSAELRKFGPFSAANHFSIADASIGADQDVGLDEAYSVILWIDDISSAPASDEYIFANRNPVSMNEGVSIRVTTAGVINVVYDTGSGTVSTAGSVVVSDGQPHNIIFGRPSGGSIWELYVDGRLDTTVTGSNGDAAITPSTTLRIGCNNDSGGAPTQPFASGKVALVRLSGTHPSAAQARHIYETERRLFEAHAKCLLQSATTDAVQSVAIDPVNGDLFVAQVDGLQRFEGLVMAEARAASGEAWTSDDHKAIRAVGGALLLANAAESYAEVPAIDLRDELSALARVAAPPGVDLSKAIAWAHIDLTVPSIINSFNIKNLNRPATGRADFFFAVPARSEVVAFASVNADVTHVRTTGISGNIGAGEGVQVRTFDSTGTPANYEMFMVAFGELENE